MEGLTYAKKPIREGHLVTITNPDGKLVARLLLDARGATCTCEWPPQEGKCLHLLLMQEQEGKLLMTDWPPGRHGKLWNWQ